jgi:hypothetical protein
MILAKNPIVSISVAGVHQAGAILGPNGVTDHSSLNATLFADYPLSEQIVRAGESVENLASESSLVAFQG